MCSSFRRRSPHGWNGSDNVANTVSGRFNFATNDAVVGPNGQLHLTESFTALASFKA